MARRLGELLVQQGALTEDQLDDMLKRQQAEHRRLGEMLVAEGLLEPEALRGALSEQSGTAAIALGDAAPGPEVLSLLPAPLMRRFEVVPLEVDGATLVLGMVDPQNMVALDAARRATGFENLSIRVITATDFAEWALAQLSEKPELSALLDAPPEPVIVTKASPDIADAPPLDAPPVVALVDHLLTEAVRRGASALHLEPFETIARVRVRVDGSLQTLLTIPRRLHGAVVARIQSLSDGELLRVGTAHGRGRFRLSIADAVFGPAMSLASLELDIHPFGDIDLPREQRGRLERALHLPHGLIVVAGPRDSGRTTLAAALVEQVARSERQIVTVSRHGAIGVPGALGFQAERPELVLDRALSQDPDVVLLDDMPLESVDGATRAALEGRLVVLTVPGERAISTIRTLATLGSPWRLASTLQAVLAVRLLRRVCGDCAVGYEPDAAVRQELGLPSAKAPSEAFKRGKGCATCWGTGYKGRVLASEVVFSTLTMREAIRASADEAELTEVARQDGFNTLWELGILAAAQGRTTVDELRIALSH